MRSFSEYRKFELEKTLPTLTVSEAIDRQFDVLRLEMLEAVKLPALLFEGGVIAESAYEFARREDYADNKLILEFVLSQYKCNFYQELISEADAAAANPLVNVKAELIAKIKEMIQSLRDNVTTILASSRPVGPSADPNLGTTAPSASAPVTSSNPSAGGHAPTASPAPAASGAAPSPGPSSSGPAWTNKYASQPAQPSPSGERPVQPDGFQPAPYGHMRPADGWMNGIRRAIVDPVKGWLKDKWRNFRRRWHKDDFREHAVLLESIILENHDSVMKVIDDFEKNMIDLVTQKFDQLTGSTSASAPMVQSSPANASNVAPVNPRGANPVAAAAARATNPTGETGPATTPVVPLDQVPAEDRPKEELRKTVSAVEGAKKLGVTINGIGARGGWNGLKTSGFIGPDGKPFAPAEIIDGREKDSAWATVRNSLYNLIYRHIQDNDPQAISNYRKAKRDSGVRATFGKNDMPLLIQSWLNYKPIKSGPKPAVLDMLDAFNKKMSAVESGHTTPPLQSAEPPAATPQAAAPKGDTAPPPAPVSQSQSAPDVGSPNKPIDQKEAVGFVEKLVKGNPEGHYIDNFPHRDEIIAMLADDIVQHGTDDVEAAIQHFIDKIKAKGGSKPAPVDQKPADNHPVQAASETTPEAKPANNALQTFVDRMTQEQKDPSNAEFSDFFDPSTLSDEDKKYVAGTDDPNSEQGWESIINRLMEVRSAQKADKPTEAPAEVPKTEPVAASNTAPVTPRKVGLGGLAAKALANRKERAAGEQPAPTQSTTPEPKAAEPVKRSMPTPEEQEQGRRAMSSRAKMSSYPGYNKLIDRYVELLNPDGTDEGMDAAIAQAEEKEQEHIDRVMDGEDPAAIVADFKKEIEELIAQQDQDAMHQITGNPLTSDQSSSFRQEAGPKLNARKKLEKMQKEGFSNIVNRFRQLLKS